MEYTLEHFIQKFESLKDEEVGTGSLSRHCVLWHCGVEYYAESLEEAEQKHPEAVALMKLFSAQTREGNCLDYNAVYRINDKNGDNSAGDLFLGRKQILEALYALRDGKAS